MTKKKNATILVKMGEKTFELQNCAKTDGRDDSFPFKAELYMNGSLLAHYGIDLLGRETDINPTDDQTKKVIDGLREWVKENYSLFYNGKKLCDLDFETVVYLAAIKYACDGTTVFDIEKDDDIRRN